MFCSKCGHTVTVDQQFCSACGQPPGIPIASTLAAGSYATPVHVARFLRPADPRLQGIGGWLALFWVNVAVLTPAFTLISVFRLRIRPWTLPLHPWTFIDVVLAAFSLVVGMMMLFPNEKTTLVLRAFFGTLLIVGVLIVMRSLTSGNDALTGMAMRKIVFVLIWATYFSYSERVRATFGRNLL